jgi:hypothetical protein
MIETLRMSGQPINMFWHSRIKPYANLSFVITVSGIVTYIFAGACSDSCKTIKVNKWACRGCRLNPTLMFKSVVGKQLVSSVKMQKFIHLIPCSFHLFMDRTLTVVPDCVWPNLLIPRFLFKISKVIINIWI